MQRLTKHWGLPWNEALVDLARDIFAMYSTFVGTVSASFFHPTWFDARELLRKFEIGDVTPPKKLLSDQLCWLLLHHLFRESDGSSGPKFRTKFWHFITGKGKEGAPYIRNLMKQEYEQGYDRFEQRASAGDVYAMRLSAEKMIQDEQRRRMASLRAL